MAVGQLTAGQLRQAIAVFCAHAYGSHLPPENRRQFTELPAEASVDDILGAAGVEKLPPPVPSAAGGYALRIGCQWYPHLKMTILPYGEPPGFVFGVDTHDHFKLPPNAPDQEAIKALCQKNQALAHDILQGWEAVDLPTQHALLRRYLHRVKSPAPAALESARAGSDERR